MSYTIYDEIVEMDMTTTQLVDLKNFVDSLITEKKEENNEEIEYPVMFLQKGDLLNEYKYNKKAIKIIQSLTDSDMRDLMSEINNSLCNSGDIWLHLKTNFEEMCFYDNN